MAFEPFFNLIRGIQGKRTTGGLGDVQNSQQLAFLRRMQKDMNRFDALKVPLHQLNIVVFDIETTGFYPEKGDEIISIGAIKISEGKILEEEVFYSLVRYEHALSPMIEELTGIQTNQVNEAPLLSEVFIKFLTFVQDCTLVAHHASHEKNFMQNASWKLFRMPFKHRIVDTSFLYRIVEPNSNLVRLDDLCEHNGIPVTNRHHALGDAKLTAKLWSIYADKVQQLGCNNLHDVYSKLART